MLDYYKILGVSPHASDRAIKTAFRQKVKQLHPDVQPQSDRQVFQQVVEAYRVLSEPQSRKQYDLYWTLFASSSQADYMKIEAIIENLRKTLLDYSPFRLLGQIKRYFNRNKTGSITLEISGKTFFTIPILMNFGVPPVDVRHALPNPKR